MKLSAEAFAQSLLEVPAWPVEGRVVVGYSGGADSASLVHLLATSGKNFVAAHLHHGMRLEADKELELCAAACAELGVQFISGHADVPALAKEQKVGLEEAGRIARYTFLREAAKQLGCVRIATAHTLTDHVETVLLHVIRGSGRRGLGGIGAVSGDLIRPLLAFDREATREYCDANGLWYFDDPANSDNRFSRSRLRNQVIPVLREINPGVNEAVSRLAAVMREEDIFLDGAAAGALERLEIGLNGALGFLTRDIEIGIDLPHFRHLPPALLRRGIRLCFETLAGELDFSQTEIIVGGVLGHTKGSVTSEGGQVVAEWTADELVVRRLEVPAQFEQIVDIPGRVESPELGWAIEIDVEENIGQTSDRSGNPAWIDADFLGDHPIVRSIQAGDKIKPLGFNGNRKLSDIISEAALTVSARRRIPILASENGPVWVPGVCIDDGSRVTAATKRVLKLAIGPARTQ